MKDLYNRIKRTVGIAPVDGGNNTDLVSAILDTSGYESLVVEIDTGVLADADAVFSIKIEDGDNASLTDNAAIPAAQLQIPSTLAATPESGFQAAFDYSNDSSVFKIGVLSCKRYVRVTISPANNTGSDPMAVTFIQGSARHQPAGATQTP